MLPSVICRDVPRAYPHSPYAQHGWQLGMSSLECVVVQRRALGLLSYTVTHTYSYKKTVLSQR